MTTAVIYARCSSSGAMESRQDTTRQVLDLQEYASLNKMDVVKVFEEHISGGKSNSERVVLQECIQFCIDNKVDILLSNELSRIGRSAFNVLETVKSLIDHHINLYLQKERFTLLDDNGKPSLFAPIMLATLSTCAEIERENIAWRLNSGRKRAIESGTCVLGRKKGTVKSKEKKSDEYGQVIKLLHQGYSIRKTAKIADVSVSTVQRVKKEFADEI